MISFVLVLGVIRIRRTIKNTVLAHPKDKLVIIHVTNFIILTTFFVVFKIHTPKQEQEKEKEITDSAQKYKDETKYYIIFSVWIVFRFYSDIFLVYLVMRFASESSNT